MSKKGYKIKIEKFYEEDDENGGTVVQHDTIYTQMVGEIDIIRIIEAVNYGDGPVLEEVASREETMIYFEECEKLMKESMYEIKNHLAYISLGVGGVEDLRDAANKALALFPEKEETNKHSVNLDEAAKSVLSTEEYKKLQVDIISDRIILRRGKSND